MTKQLPIGDDFLPGITIDNLGCMLKKEKDPKAVRRLLVYIMRKMDYSIRAIADMHHLSYSTVRDWLHRAKTNLERLYDGKSPGRPSKITEEQRKVIEQALHDGSQAQGYTTDAWSGRLVANYIYKKFGIEYTARHARNFMHRLGFRWVVPRPRHPKAASPEEKDEFKKKVHETAADLKEKGFEIFAGDACSFIPNWRPRKMWEHFMNKAVALCTLSGKRFHIIGALGNGVLYFGFYDRANSDSFIDFLKRLHRAVGKFYLVVDNASCHKSKKTKEFLDGMNGEIILKYLPAYTPELNPIEIQWREIKRANGNQMFESIDAMKTAILKMCEAKEFPVVKTFDYLIC